MNGHAVPSLEPGSFLHNIPLLSDHPEAFSFLLLQMTLQGYRRAWNRVKMSGNQQLAEGAAPFF